MHSLHTSALRASSLAAPGLSVAGTCYNGLEAALALGVVLPSGALVAQDLVVLGHEGLTGQGLEALRAAFFVLFCFKGCLHIYYLSEITPRLAQCLVCLYHFGGFHSHQKQQAQFLVELYPRGRARGRESQLPSAVV